MHSNDNSRISASLADEHATLMLARRIAQCLKPGMVVYLYGNLGAGKTTLVRGILNALGFSGRVKSPTYTLIETYHIGELHFCHFDLYRLRDENEWEAAGFRDEFDGNNIFLIEWPEHARDMIPPADLKISFEILPKSRNVTLEAGTPTGVECINGH